MKEMAIRRSVSESSGLCEETVHESGGFGPDAL